MGLKVRSRELLVGVAAAGVISVGLALTLSSSGDTEPRAASWEPCLQPEAEKPDYRLRSATFGPNGGRLAIPGKVVVKAVPGALSLPTKITAGKGHPVKTPRRRAVGDAISLEPSGLRFKKPLEVTLPLQLPKHVDLKKVRVAHRDDRTGKVEFVVPIAVTRTHATVLVHHFSTVQPVVPDQQEYGEGYVAISDERGTTDTRTITFQNEGVPGPRTVGGSLVLTMLAGEWSGPVTLSVAINGQEIYTGSAHYAGGGQVPGALTPPENWETPRPVTKDGKPACETRACFASPVGNGNLGRPLTNLVAGANTMTVSISGSWEGEGAYWGFDVALAGVSPTEPNLEVDLVNAGGCTDPVVVRAEGQPGGGTFTFSADGVLMGRTPTIVAETEPDGDSVETATYSNVGTGPTTITVTYDPERPGVDPLVQEISFTIEDDNPLNDFTAEGGGNACGFLTNTDMFCQVEPAQFPGGLAVTFKANTLGARPFGSGTFSWSVTPAGGNAEPFPGLDGATTSEVVVTLPPAPQRSGLYLVSVTFESDDCQNSKTVERRFRLNPFTEQQGFRISPIGPFVFCGPSKQFKITIPGREPPYNPPIEPESVRFTVFRDPNDVVANKAGTPSTIDPELYFNGTSGVLTVNIRPGSPPASRFDLTAKLEGFLSDDTAGIFDNFCATTPQECPADEGDAACVCMTEDSVILHNGEERLDRSDLVIPGRGEIHFAFSRRYRSQLDFDGLMGFGWTHVYNDQLRVNEDESVVRLNGGSHLDTWARNADGSYAQPTGFFGTLVRNPDASFTLREVNGLKRNYSSAGRLTSHVDRNGNTMRFEHDAQGLLTRVRDTYDRAIDFTYAEHAGQQRLVKIRDFFGREVIYGYSTQGDLTTVRTPVVSGTSTGNNFPEGRTERYAYSTGFERRELNHNLLSCTFPQEVANSGAAALSWTYGTDPNDPMTFDRVLTETRGGTNASGVAAGGTLSFQYELLNQNEPPGQLALPRGRTTMTDRNGNVSELFTNELTHHILTRRLTRGLRTGEPAAFETRSTFDADGQLIRRAFPEGNAIEITYDRSGSRAAVKNTIAVRRIADATRGGGADLVTTMSYEPLYQRLRSVTDPRGNASGFTPPLGSTGTARYTSTVFFDYQEGSDPILEATRFGISLGGILRGLGDLNGDGLTNQSAGNVVQTLAPSVLLRTGSQEASRLGSTSQVILTQTSWNDRGQPTRSIDPEGNVTLLAYHPENDPDGDGTVSVTSQPLPTTPRGYLKTTTADAETSPRRTSSSTPAVLTTTLGYDPVGNVVSILDPRGVQTKIEVNQLNEPIVVTRGADVSAAASSGQLITGEVAFQFLTKLTYDFNGRVIRSEIENRDLSTAGVGTFVDRSTTYDILHNVLNSSVEVDATTTLVTQLRYDAKENLVQVTQPEGNQHTTTYDERDLPFLVTRGATATGASTTRLDYDKNANRLVTTDAEDNDGDGQPEATTFVYDGFDRLVRATDALGNRIEHSYDVASNLLQRQVFGHPANQPAGVVTALSDVRFAHDELNRVFRVDERLFLASGFSVQRPVDLRDGDSDGLVTTFFEFDALSRSTFTIEDDGELSTTVYDGAHRVVRQVDALGNAIETEFDKNDNPVRVRSIEVSRESLVPAETFASVYVYDQLNRPIRATDNAGQTTRFSYDSRDNLIQRSDPVGAAQTDPLGLFPPPGQAGQINAPGNTKRYFYDGLDRQLLQVCDLRVGGVGGGAIDTSNAANPDGLISLSYVWDGNSRMTGIVDDNGNRTSYGYDALNRRTSQTNADLTTWQYAFDRDHNATQITDPNGTVATKTYDVLNRLVRCDVQRAVGVGGTTLETFSYDGLSRLTRCTDDNGGPATTETCDYVYDSLSRLLEEQFTGGKSVSNVFTGDGKRVRCTYPGGRVIDTVFDGIDRAKTIRDASGVIAAADFIGPGYRELRRTNGNGTVYSFLDPTGSQDQGYDAVKRIVRLRHLLPSGVAFVDRAYTYNRADVRTSEQRLEDGGLTDRYTYDSLYRVVTTQLDTGGVAGAVRRQVQQLAYRFDGVGNRVEVTRTSSTQGGQSVTALLADRTVSIGASSRVEGNVVANGTARRGHRRGRWGRRSRKSTVTLQPHAKVLGNVTGDAVTLLPKSTVDGDVATNRLRKGRRARITGNVGPATLPAEALPTVGPVAPGTLDVVARPRETVALASGSYGRVVVQARATLVLSGGTYDLESLTLGPLTVVEVQAATVVRVQGRMKLLMGACVVPVAGLAATNVRWETPSCEAVLLGNKVIFFGVLAAPNARVEVLAKVRVTGALQAKEIRVGPWSKVTAPEGSGGPGSTTLAEAYVVNEMNEYTSVGGVARGHSSNGNLQDNGTLTFLYDYKNRLIGAFDKASGNPVAGYLYYCDNRRAKKVVFSQASPGVVERIVRFFYDGNQVVEETNDSGNSLLTWVYSPVYVDEPVQMVRSTSHPLGAGTLYLHQNARADVVAVTDSAGSVVERRVFDDYGRSFDGITKQAVSGSAVGNVYGFQGRRLDSETGLLYFRARYYDPATGRFVQRDPVWDPGNFGNQYSFVGNSPVSGQDPDGLQARRVGKVKKLLGPIILRMFALGLPTRWLTTLQKRFGGVEIWVGRGSGPQYDSSFLGVPPRVYLPARMFKKNKKGCFELRDLLELGKKDPDDAGAIIEELWHAYMDQVYDAKIHWKWQKATLPAFTKLNWSFEKEEVVSDWVNKMVQVRLRLMNKTKAEIKEEFKVGTKLVWTRTKKVSSFRFKPTEFQWAVNTSGTGHTMKGATGMKVDAKLLKEMKSMGLDFARPPLDKNMNPVKVDIGLK